MGPIDFSDDSNQVLLNPRLPTDSAVRLREWLHVADHLRSHVFLLTSGSTAASEAAFKWVALSKRAILAAAEASNRFLACSSSDVWLHPLPDFHVGGVGIWTRATLLGNRVVRCAEGWDPVQFASAASESGATLSSLVPAQVHDLVRRQYIAPRSLRAILVGGGALSSELYGEARALGWPLLRTYGLSECASQVATEPIDALAGSMYPNEPVLHLLPHVQARTDSEGMISLSGESVLSGYVSLDAGGRPHYWDPKDPQGWFATEDLGSVSSRRLTLHGRIAERMKIGGELSNLGLLRRVMSDVARSLGLAGQVEIVAYPDARLEAVVGLAAHEGLTDHEVGAVVEAFNARVLPFEKIRITRHVERIPITELGKTKSAELLALMLAGG